ncbi:MAG: BrnT family toxin, partial [Desulfobacterales bacterium]|nr:BrnT family toxin [Desulfobacterales bacterium]
PLLIQDDILHSTTEKRYYALGKTNTNRFLFVVFTVRNNFIRVISARDMSRKERKVYNDE